MNRFTRKQYLFVLMLMIVSSLLGAILSGAIAKAQSNRTQQTTQVTTPIQKWEYKLVQGVPQVVNNGLEFFGNQGFEVAGFATADPSGYGGVSVLLKRP